MNEKWKAVEPEETLDRINKILTNNHIYHDIVWYNFTGPLQSCRLNLLNGKGVNGKGATTAYTIASAKAELLERLQTFQLTLFKRQKCFKDEILIGQEYFLPYVNVQNKKIEYLPSILPNSNGLASGNTTEEAIVHGLCELIERYAYLLLSRQELVFHRELSIPQEYNDFLNSLQAEATLIDISLFNIPIVLLFVKTKDLYIDIEIDCAQTFDLAIERCFTEMVQGVNFDKNNKSFLSIIGNNNLSNEDFYYGILYLRHFCIPERYINYLNNCSYDNNILVKNYQNNKEIIQIILNSTKEIFGDIFIRDYDFLGFPTVRCAIKNSYDKYLINHDEHYLNILAYLNENLLFNNNENILDIYHNLIQDIYLLSHKIIYVNTFNNDLFYNLKNKSLDFSMNFDLFQNLI